MHVLDIIWVLLFANCVTSLSTKQAPSCKYQGKLYKRGEYIENNPCSYVYCRGENEIVISHLLNCGSIKKKTNSESHYCNYQGKIYDVGEDLEVIYNTKLERCSVVYCHTKGVIATRNQVKCETRHLILVKEYQKNQADTPRTKTKISGCYFSGTFYATGVDIEKTCFGKKWCREIYCDEHGVVKWKLQNPISTTVTAIKTTSLPTTITTPITTIETTVPMNGCFVDGTLYAPGQDIDSGSDGEGWCFGRYCDYSGQVINWDDWKCGEITTTESITAFVRDWSTTSTVQSETTIPTTKTEAIAATTSPTQDTTFSAGCTVNGKHYAFGEEINSGYDESSNWCYGSSCDSSGQVLAWDNFDCRTTTTEQTTVPYTTTSITDGCVVQGKRYNPGQEITSEYEPNLNRCFGRYCDQHGQIVTWDNSNCHTTTTTPPPPPTTTRLPTTTTSTTTPYTTASLNCLVDEKQFAPGEKIDSGYDASTNWCYGRFCDLSGQIVNWDNFNCRTTTTPTTKTTPVTITTTTTPKGPGCYVNGNYYNPGQEIDSGSDGGQWCFGRICEYGGSISHWDNFNCSPTTLPTTTVDF